MAIDETSAEGVREARFPARLDVELDAGGRRLAAVVRQLGWGGLLCTLSPADGAHLESGHEATVSFHPFREFGPILVQARVAELTPSAVDHRGAEAVAVDLCFTDRQDLTEEALDRLIGDQQPLVLLAGFEAQELTAYRRALRRDFQLVSTRNEEEALDVLDRREVAVLCLGSAISGERALSLLESATRKFPGNATLNVVLAAGSNPEIFLDLIEEDKVFYLTPEGIPPVELGHIVQGAMGRYREAALQAPAASDAEARRKEQRLIRAARQVVAHKDLAGAGQAFNQTVQELFQADRAYCLLYDKATETLWMAGPGNEERRESSAVGLVSFVARTGQRVLVSKVGEDPRYDADADDPEGTGDEHFLAVPMTGPGGRLIGVVAAVRAAFQPDFSTASAAALAVLTGHVGTTFSQLELRWRNSAEGVLQETEVREFSSKLFRKRAVDRFREGERGEGDVLRISPVWMQWSYWLLLAVLAGGLLFSWFGTVREYASGPAVVLTPGAGELTATAVGTVTSVDVQPGEQVEAGALLVRFYGAQEAAELRRIESEFKLQLVRRLRDPSDAGAGQALIALRAQRDLGRERLEQRFIRAPRAGTVGDVRVREGQHIAPGQILVSLAGEESASSLVAMLPGQYRPQLKPGMSLRFELQGYKYVYQHLLVSSVGEEVIGPAEAQRFLGQEIADAVDLTGPVVLVYARLPDQGFQSQGRDFRYHDGMWGVVELPVQSERILVTLVPALRTVFGRGGHG